MAAVEDSLSAAGLSGIPSGKRSPVRRNCAKKSTTKPPRNGLASHTHAEDSPEKSRLLQGINGQSKIILADALQNESSNSTGCQDKQAPVDYNLEAGTPQKRPGEKLTARKSTNPAKLARLQIHDIERRQVEMIRAITERQSPVVPSDEEIVNGDGECSSPVAHQSSDPEEGSKDDETGADSPGEPSVPVKSQIDTQEENSNISLSNEDNVNCISDCDTGLPVDSSDGTVANLAADCGSAKNPYSITARVKDSFKGLLKAAVTKVTPKSNTSADSSLVASANSSRSCSPKPPLNDIDTSDKSKVSLLSDKESLIDKLSSISNEEAEVSKADNLEDKTDNSASLEDNEDQSEQQGDKVLSETDIPSTSEDKPTLSEQERSNSSTKDEETYTASETRSQNVDSDNVQLNESVSMLDEGEVDEDEDLDDVDDSLLDDSYDDKRPGEQKDEPGKTYNCDEKTDLKTSQCLEEEATESKSAVEEKEGSQGTNSTDNTDEAGAESSKPVENDRDSASEAGKATEKGLAAENTEVRQVEEDTEEKKCDEEEKMTSVDESAGDIEMKHIPEDTEMKSFEDSESIGSHENKVSIDMKSEVPEANPKVEMKDSKDSCDSKTDKLTEEIESKATTVLTEEDKSTAQSTVVEKSVKNEDSEKNSLPEERSKRSASSMDGEEEDHLAKRSRLSEMIGKLGSQIGVAPEEAELEDLSSEESKESDADGASVTSNEEDTEKKARKPIKMNMKAMDAYIKKRIETYIEATQGTTIAELQKKINDLQTSNEMWKNKAADLHKQLVELSRRQQRQEQLRRGPPKVGTRHVNIQVDMSRVQAAALQKQQQQTQATAGRVVAKPPPRSPVVTSTPTTQGGLILLSPAVTSTPSSGTTVSATGTATQAGVRNVQYVASSNIQGLVPQAGVATAASTQTVASNAVYSTASGAAKPVASNTSQSVAAKYPRSSTVKDILELQRSGGEPAKKATTTTTNPASQVTTRTVVQAPGTPIVGRQGQTMIVKGIIDLTDDDDSSPKSKAMAVGQAAGTIVQTTVANTTQILSQPIAVRQAGGVAQAVGTATIRPGAYVVQGTPAGTPMVVQQLVSQSARPPGTTYVYTTAPPRPGTVMVQQPGGNVVRGTLVAASQPPQLRAAGQVITVQRPNSSTAQVVTRLPPPLQSAPGTQATHPAPLPPQVFNQTTGNTSKHIPPKPGLKISRVQQGIVLSWNMTLTEAYADIANYQLFAYQEGTAPPSTSLWKKVGDVKALPLPMACTLTQFQEGNKYHFAVRAVDTYGRVGPFSEPSSIHLTVSAS